MAAGYSFPLTSPKDWHMTKRHKMGSHGKADSGLRSTSGVPNVNFRRQFSQKCNHIAATGSMTTAAIALQWKGSATSTDRPNDFALPPTSDGTLSSAKTACDPQLVVENANRSTMNGIKLVVGHYRASSSMPSSDV